MNDPTFQKLNISAVYAKQRQHSETFVRGSDGYLHYYYFENGIWNHDGESFKAAKVDGAISVVFAPQRNHSEVFFQGEDGYLHYYYVPVETGVWSHDGESFKAARVNGAVSAVFATPRNHSEVFFLGDDSYPHCYYVPIETGGWTHEMLGSASIFTGGYYDLDIPGLGWAQHTYVLANHGYSNEVKFACYGSCDPDHHLAGSIYPATLYKPEIFPPYTTYGKQVDGNLRLARGIACGNVNATPREDYDQKTGGSYLFGDCCGLIYAVNGVCHNMEARIFWACRNTPVIWPPTVTGSYWVWFDKVMMTGFYGNNWFIWKPIFEKMKTSVSQQGVRSVQDEAEMLDLMRKSARAALAQAEQPEFREALAQTIPAEAVPSRAAAYAVPEEMVEFHRIKAELDRQLLKGTVSREEYATQLNQQFLATMRKMKDMLSPEGYEKTFGRSAAEPEISLAIDASKIPDNLGELKLID